MSGKTSFQGGQFSGNTRFQGVHRPGAVFGPEHGLLFKPASTYCVL